MKNGECSMMQEMMKGTMKGMMEGMVPKAETAPKADVPDHSSHQH
jgi:hypothetical protein